MFALNLTFLSPLSLSHTTITNLLRLWKQKERMGGRASMNIKATQWPVPSISTIKDTSNVFFYILATFTSVDLAVCMELIGRKLEAYSASNVVSPLSARCYKEGSNFRLLE